MARVRWEPVCGARADRPGAPAHLWRPRRRQRSRAGAADGPRQPYLSDHFLNQIRYWGIRPSYGFVEEPETNGVAERWNRTLKEQAIHGRIFQNLKEVRAAVTAFVERYNTTWPREARVSHAIEAPRRTSYAGRQR